MFYKKREENNRATRRTSSQLIGSESITVNGVSCYVSLYKDGGSSIRATVSYNHDEVSWADRSGFESDVKYTVMRGLNARNYHLSNISFY
ncbi:MAG: hypothetical protein NC033_05250 [Clostridiales bacterium]|nr:hypothetical protein [Clostridiales bacterium]